MLVVALDEGSGMDALTAILLPALGTYEGRLVVVTEPAISCTVATHTASPQQTFTLLYQTTTRMWANDQRDGRPAEYRWRPLFNAARFG